MARLKKSPPKSVTTNDTTSKSVTSLTIDDAAISQNSVLGTGRPAEESNNEASIPLSLNLDASDQNLALGAEKPADKSTFLDRNNIKNMFHILKNACDNLQPYLEINHDNNASVTLESHLLLTTEESKTEFYECFEHCIDKITSTILDAIGHISIKLNAIADSLIAESNEDKIQSFFYEYIILKRDLDFLMSGYPSCESQRNLLRSLHKEAPAQNWMLGQENIANYEDFYTEDEFFKARYDILHYLFGAKTPICLLSFQGIMLLDKLMRCYKIPAVIKTKGRKPNLPPPPTHIKSAQKLIVSRDSLELFFVEAFKLCLSEIFSFCEHNSSSHDISPFYEHKLSDKFMYLQVRYDQLYNPILTYKLADSIEEEEMTFQATNMNVDKFLALSSNHSTRQSSSSNNLTEPPPFMNFSNPPPTTPREISAPLEYLRKENPQLLTGIMNSIFEPNTKLLIPDQSSLELYDFGVTNGFFGKSENNVAYFDVKAFTNKFASLFYQETTSRYSMYLMVLNFLCMLLNNISLNSELIKYMRNGDINTVFNAVANHLADHVYNDYLENPNVDRSNLSAQSKANGKANIRKRITRATMAILSKIDLDSSSKKCISSADEITDTDFIIVKDANTKNLETLLLTNLKQIFNDMDDDDKRTQIIQSYKTNWSITDKRSNILRTEFPFHTQTRKRKVLSIADGTGEKIIDATSPPVKKNKDESVCDSDDNNDDENDDKNDDPDNKNDDAVPIIVEDEDEEEEEEEYPIHGVYQHRGNTVKTLEFRCDYGPKYPINNTEWIPYKPDLCQNILIFDYLRSNNMEIVILKEYRDNFITKVIRYTPDKRTRPVITSLKDIKFKLKRKYSNLITIETYDDILRSDNKDQKSISFIDTFIENDDFLSKLILPAEDDSTHQEIPKKVSDNIVNFLNSQSDRFDTKNKTIFLNLIKQFSSNIGLSNNNDNLNTKCPLTTSDYTYNTVFIDAEIKYLLDDFDQLLSMERDELKDVKKSLLDIFKTSIYTELVKNKKIGRDEKVVIQDYLVNANGILGSFDQTIFLNEALNMLNPMLSKNTTKAEQAIPALLNVFPHFIENLIHMLNAMMFHSERNQTIVLPFKFFEIYDNLENKNQIKDFPIYTRMALANQLIFIYPKTSTFLFDLLTILTFTASPSTNENEVIVNCIVIGSNPHSVANEDLLKIVDDNILPLFFDILKGVYKKKNLTRHDLFQFGKVDFEDYDNNQTRYNILCGCLMLVVNNLGISEVNKAVTKLSNNQDLINMLHLVMTHYLIFYQTILEEEPPSSPEESVTDEDYKNDDNNEIKDQNINNSTPGVKRGESVQENNADETTPGVTGRESQASSVVQENNADETTPGVTGRENHQASSVMQENNADETTPGVTGRESQASSVVKVMGQALTSLWSLGTNN